MWGNFARSLPLVLLRERVKSGIAHAREKGKNHGRPQTASKKESEIKKLNKEGLNNSQIAKKLKIGRSSIIRILKKQ